MQNNVSEALRTALTRASGRALKRWSKIMNTVTDTQKMSDQPKRAQRRRGYRFFIKRGLLALAILLVVLPVLGFSYEAIMAAGDATRYPPPGQLIDVGGYRLHISCNGTSPAGSATVVVENGLGGTTLDWSLMQPDIATTTRICAYDRAGFGWSESGSAARTSQQIATELHTLLHNAGIAGPYILVGHSLGGLHVQMYASQYPDEVAGLVLLDPTPATYFAQLTAPERQAALPPTGMFRMLQLIHPFGLTRLLDFGPWKMGMPIERLPPDIQPAVKALSFKPTVPGTFYAEGAAFETSLAQLVAATPFRADIPLIVLLRGRVMGPPDQDTAGKAANAALIQRSANGQLVVAENSGHYIQFERPDLVIAAVRQVVEAVRTGQPLRP
jgi:pimeloyl-ACP methyl ester carboxylesterase